MGHTTRGTTRQELHQLFRSGSLAARTDGQLLEWFATGRDADSENAFAALVARHGPMVLRVCRGVLRNEADALDAFQATFLVLARQGGRLWVADSLGPWLHRVACRAACRARVLAGRRRTHERRAAEQAPAPAPEGADRDDRAAILHEELDRLPERYRVPIVLCDLEGRSCEEAASYLGCPVGTVKSWRSRGRRRLRAMLARRGLGALVLPGAGLRLPPLAGTAIASLTRMAADPRAAGTVPAAVSRLTEGVLRSMLIAKLRTAAAAVVVGLLAATAAVVAEPPQDRGAGTPTPPGSGVPSDPPAAAAALADPRPRPPRLRIRPLTLAEAIYRGVDGWSEARVIEFDSRAETAGKPPGRDGSAPRVVVSWLGPSSADEAWQRKARLMELVRTIEERYWALAQQHAQLWGSEKAVELAEEIKKREESELEAGRGTTSDVAEATQRLEQFRLDLVSKTSDVSTAEEHLRSLLALDSRDALVTLMPANVPIESEIKLEWDPSLAEMFARSPEVVRQREKINALMKHVVAVDPLMVAASVEAKNASPELRKELGKYNAVVQRTIHALAKHYLEIDADFKQFKTASRLRAAAARRLEAQRAFYEANRIGAQQYLDAVSQHTNAVAQEAQAKTTYNIAIARFEEAKGTLLAYDNIQIVSRPPQASPGVAFQPAPVALPAPAPSPAPTAAPAPAAGSSTPAALPAANPSPAPAPAASPAPVITPAPPAPSTARSKEGAKRMEFDFRLDLFRPVRVRGTLSITPAADDAR